MINWFKNNLYNENIHFKFFIQIGITVKHIIVISILHLEQT